MFWSNHCSFVFTVTQFKWNVSV